jgi:murein DD-endopeptidase MepM/ murein hydrolase activator NlpD
MPQRPVNTFIWPVRGEVISPFGAGEGGVRNKGIDIKASEGTIVRAAGAGRVVYSDQYLKGFGRTVIIDHGGGFETVYAYNSAIIAKVGTVVGQNDIIAKVGSTGRARIPSLHFEIRKDGKPVNPAYYLRLPNNGN